MKTFIVEYQISTSEYQILAESARAAVREVKDLEPEATIVSVREDRDDAESLEVIGFDEGSGVAILEGDSCHYDEDGCLQICCPECGSTEVTFHPDTDESPGESYVCDNCTCKFGGDFPDDGSEVIR